MKVFTNTYRFICEIIMVVLVSHGLAQVSAKFASFIAPHFFGTTKDIGQFITKNFGAYGWFADVGVFACAALVVVVLPLLYHHKFGITPAKVISILAIAALFANTYMNWKVLNVDQFDLIRSGRFDGFMLPVSYLAVISWRLKSYIPYLSWLKIPKLGGRRSSNEAHA